ncbi:unnamed protein product, partial [Vitis vinifera]
MQECIQPWHMPSHRLMLRSHISLYNCCIWSYSLFNDRI